MRSIGLLRTKQGSRRTQNTERRKTLQHGDRDQIGAACSRNETSLPELGRLLTLFREHWNEPNGILYARPVRPRWSIVVNLEYQLYIVEKTEYPYQ